jgi:hypothetical protein
VERGKRKKAQLKRAYVRIRVTKEGQLRMFAGIIRDNGKFTHQK